MLRLRPAREGIDEVDGGVVDVPLGDGAAKRMDDDRSVIAAEEVLLIAVDVVVALLAGGDSPLREVPLRFQQRRVRVGAQVRQVDAAEDAVPVDVIALPAPEMLLRLAHLGRGVEDAAACEVLGDQEHPLVQRVRFGVAIEELPPLPAAHQPLQLVFRGQRVLRRGHSLRHRGVERPLHQLGIGAARDVHAPGRLGEDPGVLEGGRLQEFGLLDGAEELVQPAVLVHALERARPGAELLAVVGVDDEARTTVVALAQLLDRGLDRPERNEVPKPHASGEHHQRQPLILGQEGARDLLGAHAGVQKVRVVQHRIGDAGFGEDRRYLGFPHAFREPRAERPAAECRRESIR